MCGCHSNRMQCTHAVWECGCVLPVNNRSNHNYYNAVQKSNFHNVYVHTYMYVRVCIPSTGQLLGYTLVPEGILGCITDLVWRTSYIIIFSGFPVLPLCKTLPTHRYPWSRIILNTPAATGWSHSPAPLALSFSGNEALLNSLKHNCNYCGKGRMFIPKLEFSRYSLLLCGYVHVYSTTTQPTWLKIVISSIPDSP